MKLITLSEKEFKKFADKSTQISFYQTSEWANLKKKNGWVPHFLGLKNDEKIIGASLILSKKIKPINKNLFYAPRGFLIDYTDKELLSTWTKELKKYIRENKGIFVKIDPYIEYQERDNEGQIVKHGRNNYLAHKNLKELGYKHFGFNLMQETLQPRWMHVIDTKGLTLEEVNAKMDSKTRQILRKNERCGITVREIEKDELKTFKEIMQKTSDRREFIDRPFSYYESMWDSLHDSGILKILIGEIDFNIYEKNTIEELEQNKKELEDRIYKHDNNLLHMNEKKYKNSNKLNEDAIKRLESDLEKINNYKKEFGEKQVLGGILFLIYGNEVLSLLGGTLDNVMNFKSAYNIHYAGIKYAVENKYNRYNFYGITGIFDPKNPLYGLYLFKKSFGGHVVELNGEYNLVISKPWYFIYNVAFNTYHLLKNIKAKIKK